LDGGFAWWEGWLVCASLPEDGACVVFVLAPEFEL
jgi:hypothetical protein